MKKSGLISRNTLTFVLNLQYICTSGKLTVVEALELR